jgi:hypothetical protein
MLGVLAVTGWCAQPVASQASDEDRFLEGLRQRRLFELAEVYCERRLAEQQLSESERGLLVVELIRCLAEHAANARPDERVRLWEQARHTAAKFLADYPQHPRRILIRMQDALTVLAQGELARMESELGVAGATPVAEARTAIREAVKLLTNIEQELDERIALHNDLRPAEDLSIAELRALQQNVRFQKARALQNLGLSYPAKSADRKSQLSQAQEQLGTALLQVAPDQPLAHRMRIDQIVCYRLLGDINKARQFLDAFPQDDVSAEIRNRWQAERIRLVLASEGPKAAWSLISQERGTGNDRWPELDFARLETQIGLWQAAAENKEAEAAQWRDEALASVERIERAHGPYWARRAELLLLETGRGRGGGSLDLLERTAADFYIKGRLDEALAAYDEAAKLATEAASSDQAFAFAYKAALLQQQRKQHADAARRFAELASAMPDAPNSGNAHLHAIVNVAQQIAEDPASQASYVRLLDEHLQQWSEDPTADTARLWLGRYHQSQGSWDAAVRALRDISPTAAFRGEAIERLIQTWLAWLAELAATAAEPETIAEDAVDYLDRVAQNGETAPANDISTRAKAAIAAARIRLDYTSTDPAVVESRLRAVLQEAPPAPADWQAEAQVLLVAALAAQPGRGEDATNALAQVESPDVDLWYPLLLRVGRLTENATGQRSRELGAIQRLAAENLKQHLATLEDGKRRVVERLRAVALSATGSQAEAVVEWEKLAQRYPDDVSIQQSFGEWLSRSDDPDLLQQAAAQWRKIAARSRPRTARWFHAKYQLAEVLFQLGDKASVSKLIRYLRATEDLSQTVHHQDFLNLLDRCER